MKLTIGLARSPANWGDQRAYRIDHSITEKDIMNMTKDDRLVYLKIGMEMVELPESVFRRLYAAVDTAYHAGMSHSEDAKRLHGLED